MIPPLTCIFQCIKILFSDKHSAMGKWFEVRIAAFYEAWNALICHRFHLTQEFDVNTLITGNKK